MELQQTSVLLGWCDIQIQLCGMLVHCMKCVAEVHQKGITFPTELVLDEGVGEPGAMEEVGCRDTDGVCAPQFKLWAACREGKHRLSDRL